MIIIVDRDKIKKNLRKRLQKDLQDVMNGNKEVYSDEEAFEYAYINKLIEIEKTRKTLGEWKL